MDGVDMKEWCPSCNRLTLHRRALERVTGPGVFARLKWYCRECGGMSKEVAFK